MNNEDEVKLPSVVPMAAASNCKWREYAAEIFAWQQQAMKIAKQ